MKFLFNKALHLIKKHNYLFFLLHIKIRITRTDLRIEIERFLLFV
jgi:hypothetical protein